MKKFLKVLAAAAAVAAVVPFHAEGDKNKGAIKALLWRADWDIDPDYQSQSDINVLIGFNNPFKSLNKESELFADDLVVDYCCDGETVTYTDDCTCSEDCTCGDECTCNEAPAAEPVEEAQTECTCGEDCDEE